MTDLKKITVEELQLERIAHKLDQKVHCSTDARCTDEGNYIRCYLDTCVFCPYYVSYGTIMHSDDRIGRLETFEEGGGFDNSHCWGV